MGLSSIQMLSSLDCPGLRNLVGNLVDNIHVEGDNLKDLYTKVWSVLLYCHENGYLLSKMTFEIRLEVDFAWYIVSAQIADFLTPKELPRSIQSTS